MPNVLGPHRPWILIGNRLVDRDLGRTRFATARRSQSPRLWILGLLAAGGCAAAPSPLQPLWRGSIGTPVCGVLAGGEELPRLAPGLRWLRVGGRHWAQPRFVAAIERAAALVATERPGSVLSVGDLSSPRGGGPALPHFSHRSGMDADLLFYVTSTDGTPIESPGFVHVGADGLARDTQHGRWVRLDVAREWLLVKTLVSDPDARVQWIFVSDVVKAMLEQWALSRGEPSDVLVRTMQVMAQPARGGVHDDHLHVRSTCSPDEMASGCEPIGPRRPWMTDVVVSSNDNDEDLALALAAPLVPGNMRSSGLPP